MSTTVHCNFFQYKCWHSCLIMRLTLRSENQFLATLSKTTLLSGISQSSSCCRAQLFCCCNTDNIYNSGPMHSRSPDLHPPLKKTERKKKTKNKKRAGQLPGSNPAQAQRSRETWLVRHPTSASNSGRLLDLLCNCQPSHTAHFFV